MSKLQTLIDSIADVRDSSIPNDEAKVYCSKIDGSYLTRVGMEASLNHLLKLGITEQVQAGHGEPTTANIGFNPVVNKWFGWSHREIFGFGVGSKCKKGDCGYEPKNKQDFAEACFAFWGEDSYSIGDGKFEFGEGPDHTGKKEVKGVWVTYTYSDKVPNKSLIGTEYTHFSQFPDKWGKGEWTANNLEEAKEMAIDFARGVS